MNRRAGPFWCRWRVKRLERELSDLLREVDAVYAQLEQAYREAEEVTGAPRLRLVPARTFDGFPECEHSNVIPMRRQ